MQKHYLRYRSCLRVTALCASALLFSLSNTGCSIKKLASRALTDVLSGDQSLVFTGENDPELAAASLPTILKVYEALIERTPGDPVLLTAAGKAFALYAFAFIQAPADRMGPQAALEQAAQYRRAKSHYLRSRDYLLESLDIQRPGFRDALLDGKADAALALTRAADTSALYWCGVAWMGHLTVGKPGLGALLNLAKAAAMVHKVIEYNDSFDNGAAHEAMIAYYGLAPKAMGGDTAKAREHFERAVELSGDRRVRPYLSYATGVVVKRGDRGQFEELLGKALAVDTRERDDNRLANIVLQESARWWLARADELFVDTPRE